MSGFNVETAGHAMARFLELVADSESFNDWYKRNNIDQDFLYALVSELDDGVFDQSENAMINAFLMGFVVAWEAKR